MIKVELGAELLASRVRSGNSARGAWELIVIKEEGKGRKVINVWPSNTPSGVVEGQKFKIMSVEMIKYSSRKDNYGTWQDDLSINAVVEPVGVVDNGFSDADDEDLPFTMNSNPFTGNPFGAGTNPFDSSDPFNIDDELPL